MTDDTTEVVEPTESATEPVEATETTDLAAELEKWKALSRKNEARAKQNDEAAKRLAEIEDANRSELERAQAKVAELERVAAEANAAKVRSDIAREKGVPIELLTGSDEETLNAQADRLLEFKGKPPTAPSSDGQGKQGDPVSGQVKQLSREDLKSMTPAQIEAAYDAGQLNDAQGIH